MRVPLVFAVPLAGLLALGGLLTLYPASAEWPRQPLFVSLPYLVFGLAAALGIVFTQTRIAYLAVYMAAAVFLLHRAFFVVSDPLRGQAVILLAATFVPVQTAMVYRLGERGLFTAHGATRSLALGVSVLFLVLLPLSAGFQDSIAASLPPTFRTAEGLLRVPGLGLLALLGSAPFLLIRNRHESPRLGPLLGLAVLFFFAALNLQSSMWRPAQQTALLLFASAGGLVLAGAALESAWHHMNMDELTELPGRRPLKHHLRCLAGSYALAVVDLDHFKQVNDTHGHLVGDQVLRYLARLLVSQATGTVYRYGGEEFVIVYDRREFDAVLADLEEVRAAVEDKAFAIRGRDRPTRKPRRRKPGPARNVRTIRLTVSIGAARSGPRYAGAQDVLDAADRALYEAKTSGRNRVCAAS